MSLHIMKNILYSSSFHNVIKRKLINQTSTSTLKIQNRTTSNNYVNTKIGNREIVGHGVNSNSIYIDWITYPFPGIRFREETPEIVELREKERNNWKDLTVEEMKDLYRASFCQTFAEIKAPTGEWKISIACLFHVIAISLATMILLKKCVYSELPETYSEDRIKAQFRRIIDLEMNPITGISSHWDYVNKKPK